MTPATPTEVSPYAIEVNLNVDIGGDFSYGFVWKQINDQDYPYNPKRPPTGIDLSGCTAAIEIKRAHEAATVVLTAPDVVVVVEKDSVTGALDFEVTKEQIEALLPRTKYVYSIVVTFPSGHRRKFSKGKFELTY